MKQPPNLTPFQLEESLRKLQRQTLLETLQYQSLIDEIEKCIITNKQPFLLKTYEEMKEYPQILYYTALTPSLSTADEKSKFYFHLMGIEVEPNSKYKKQTAEDNMHINIQLTLVYC